MSLLTLESGRRSEERSTCPHCGHSLSKPSLPQGLQTILGVLAAVAMVLIMIPLSITVWKSCADMLSDDQSRSVLFRPLEDWTHY
jgi:uncharacterized paraquat-inducible protein A